MSLRAIVALLGGWRAAAFALAAVLALSCAGVQTMRVSHLQARVARGEADLAQATAYAAEQTTKASEAARSEEQTRARYIAGIADAYEKGKADAQQTADRVAGDLRSGNLRLRHELAALAARGVPGGPTPAGEPSDAAERGAELAGAAVGVGAQCDARIAALIAAYDAASGKVQP